MDQGKKEDKNKAKAITSKAENYSEWYLDIIDAAKLADSSPVRGCMVIRPYGYAIWENIHNILDARFKELGVENAYFPLLIPKSFLEREAKHAEGFAKEVAIVTHHRLKMGENGKLIPDSELEEPLIIRPTSETIMYDTFSRWINSYRDLPLLINQWANVVRWELRTKPFLRTMEFLWQEGHTVHANKEGADEMTLGILDIYAQIAEEYLAMPVIRGYKTESEKFAGADYTTCIEAMMQDTKALQAGTSHMLGQNFAKEFDVKFLDENEKTQYGWQTSWGVSTRIMGGLIMTHSDDKGLVLPPRIAPTQVVIVPIWGGKIEDKEKVVQKAKEIAGILKQENISVKVDERDDRPGNKFFEWEKKGVPVRIEIGPRDMENKSVIAVRRDTGEKSVIVEDKIASEIKSLLETIQKNLYERALKFRQDNTFAVDSWAEFVAHIPEVGKTNDGKEKQCGFLEAHWCGNADCEAKIKELTKATIRCIPFDAKKEKGKCILCGGESEVRAIFAKAY